MAYLIFDYDGTLFDSMSVYGASVRAAHTQLVQQGIMQPREISEEELHSYLGITTQQMWERFAPELSPKEREMGGRLVGEELTRRIRAGEARLYDGVPEMMRKLRTEGHRLVYLSNCNESYMQMHAEVFGLHALFDEMHCCGQFGWARKPEIVNQLMTQENVDSRHVIAIGDRYTDMEIGRECKIPVIWCAYGYGTEAEGAGADCTAHSVAEIPDCVAKLTKE